MVVLPHLGLTGHWPDGKCQAAMWRSVAVQPLTATNDRLSLRAMAGPDPILTLSKPNWMAALFR